jgi:hypothetical protein
VALVARITRAVGVSRNTVKAVLAAHAGERSAPHSALPAPTATAPRPRKTDAFRGRIAELFVRYPDITARRVFEILRDEQASSPPDLDRARLHIEALGELASVEKATSSKPSGRTRTCR